MIYSYPSLRFVIDAETVEQANFYRDQVLALLKECKSYSEIKGLYPVTFSDEPINTPIIETTPKVEKTTKKTEKDPLKTEEFEKDFI